MRMYTCHGRICLRCACMPATGVHACDGFACSFWKMGAAPIMYSTPEKMVQMVATISRASEISSRILGSVTVWLLKVSMSGKSESPAAPSPLASRMPPMATSVMKVFCLPQMPAGITLHFAADDYEDDPCRHETDLHQRDQNSGDEDLVGGQVQEDADLGNHFVAARQVAVEKVGDGGKQEDERGEEKGDGLVDKDEYKHQDGPNHPADTEQIRNVLHKKLLVAMTTLLLFFWHSAPEGVGAAAT